MLVFNNHVCIFVEINKYKCMKKFRYETREDIQSQLRIGDMTLIAEMTGKSRQTIYSQLLGLRTLKPYLVEAANLLIETRESLLNTNT